MNKEERKEYMKAWRLANKEKYAAIQKTWIISNKEKIAAKNKAWNLANKEKKAALNKAYILANKEKVAATAKAWVLANKEKYDVTAKKWALNNKDKLEANAAKRRVFKINAEAKMTKAEKENYANLVIIRDNATKLFGSKWSIDHIIPISKGGTNTVDNLEVVPLSWNAGKGNRNSESFWG